MSSFKTDNSFLYNHNRVFRVQEDITVNSIVLNVSVKKQNSRKVKYAGLWFLKKGHTEHK